MINERLRGCVESDHFCSTITFYTAFIYINRYESDIKPVTGKHALVFVFKAVDPATKGLDLMNLEWFVFENR